MSGNWLEFWNGEHSIYVNERHKMLHDRLVARDVAALVPSGKPVVLDFGCGEASEAREVAKKCGTLYSVGRRPRRPRAGRGALCRRPRHRGALARGRRGAADGSLDLVVVNSLLQYLSREELGRWLAVFRAKLKPRGRLVIGDVIPPDVSPVTDAAALLRFGMEGGFLFAALGRPGANAVLGLPQAARRGSASSTYSQPDIQIILEGAGFSAERRYPNLGHNQARMTFVARPL